MRRECRERFPRRRLQRKPLVSDPGIHHGTCVTHVPRCMSGSLTRGGGESDPGILGACAPAIVRIWQEANGHRHIQSPSKCVCHRSSFWRRFVTYAIFYWQSFQGNTLHPLAIIHMEDINVLDFDDKSERNLWVFCFGNLGIIFNGASAQLFPPREKW